jgi:ribosomal protein L35
MPKLKTKKTLLRRIKITGSKKILKNKVGNAHLKIKVHSGKKGRSKGYTSVLTKGYRKNFKKMLAKRGAKI